MAVMTSDPAPPPVPPPAPRRWCRGGLVLVLVLATAPAGAQTPVYVPHMGPAAPSTPLPSTVTPGPRVYVPDSGRVGPGLRFPDPVEVPRAARTSPSSRRNATVPSPIHPHAGRIVVPDRLRRGETSQDRVARCQHYGALYGVPAGQRGAYIHNCAMGN